MIEFTQLAVVKPGFKCKNSDSRAHTIRDTEMQRCDLKKWRNNTVAILGSNNGLLIVMRTHIVPGLVLISTLRVSSH